MELADWDRKVMQDAAERIKAAVKQLAAVPVFACCLGVTCRQHNPPKVEPHIPVIDDWDLLPDAPMTRTASPPPTPSPPDAPTRSA
jgi:hypothetical protein